MNLEQRILRDIEKNGSISFARFMESALYAPDLGYYEQKDRVGRVGDFYTSVSVGSVFGELLAAQFCDWLSENETGSALQIIEAGAHDGQLARDILTELQRIAPGLFERIQYGILEPSARHREWQRDTLSGFSNVRWFDDWEQVDEMSGIIFSNELLDAMPFHRLQWSSAKRQWQEMKVTSSGERLVWTLGTSAPELPGTPKVPDELAEVLPDGFQTELSPDALNWWKSAAAKLKQGRLMAIDYGLFAEEFFAPERSRGTARAYANHRMTEDLLANIGEQDITCHVNFSTVMGAGESVGLKTEFFGTQARFLTSILDRQMRSGRALPNWDRKQTAQFQTLTHPAHLGTKFKVLVQFVKQ